MMKPTSEFPWSCLSTPREVGAFEALLVQGDANPKGRRIYWARSWRGHASLLLEYDSSSWTSTVLPVFKNISVQDCPDESTLALELTSSDGDASELFLKVCNDIIETLQKVPVEDGRLACIYRLERWSAFLKTGRPRLSAEGQKGLIAELRFLQRDMIGFCDAHAALMSWTGPDGDARDFSYGQTFIEVKSKRSSARHEVAVSSEDQLNTNGAERLFLCVREINSASSGDGRAFTVSDVVKEVRAAFESPLQRGLLDSKLAAAGFFDEDDYSDCLWSEGATDYYEVKDGFPRLCSSNLTPGVRKVTYHIDLDFCREYLVGRNDILMAME